MPYEGEVQEHLKAWISGVGGVASLNTRCYSQGACRSAYTSDVPTSKVRKGEEILCLLYKDIWRIVEPRVLSKRYVEGEKKARGVVATPSIRDFCIPMP